MEEIIELAAKQYEEILDDRNREDRKAAISLIGEYTAMTNREIGEQMGGVSYSAVSNWWSVWRKRWKRTGT
ncbi:MAG TPA: hypothetical protein ENH40_04270 [Nitrospirae bacterium]|nr:hypothetical protein [Nitrospirota bacterium]